MLSIILSEPGAVFGFITVMGALLVSVIDPRAEKRKKREKKIR